MIRGITKPVIAAVNGWAIGGGHIIHVICDLSVAADTAKFSQAGPKGCRRKKGERNMVFMQNIYLSGSIGDGSCE